MCACAFKNGNRRILQNQGFVNIIPTSQFINQTTYNDFMFYRCVSESRFLQALETVRMPGNSTLGKQIKTDADVRKLAELSDKKWDVSMWGVDVKKLLDSIKFDQKELDNAQCRIAFSTND